MKPQVGDVAPLFTAPVVVSGDDPESTVASVSLADLRGERVVLVFYPKDDTPGCTQQACALRDDWSGLAGRARIFGVSVDPVKSHRKFIRKHALPYPLLSDESKEIVQAYGVWGEKSFMGRKYLGTERSTFVIGADGRIAAVLERVSPADHLRLLHEALA